MSPTTTLPMLPTTILRPLATLRGFNPDTELQVSPQLRQQPFPTAIGIEPVGSQSSPFPGRSRSQNQYRQYAGRIARILEHTLSVITDLEISGKAFQSLMIKWKRLSFTKEKIYDLCPKTVFRTIVRLCDDQ